MDTLDLHAVNDREVDKLSGGELQRFAIGVVVVQKADVYMFDEPSSYLDVMQRLKAGRAIRSLLAQDTYVICVEHDLSVLDYLSDYICCLYGSAGHYGVVTMPFSVREGINIFLAGFIPTENSKPPLPFENSGPSQPSRTLPCPCQPSRTLPCPLPPCLLAFLPSCLLASLPSCLPAVLPSCLTFRPDLEFESSSWCRSALP